MKITHTLIQKFLENRCTAGEASRVSRHLEKHPELITIYLKSSWNAGGIENCLPAGYAKEMQEAIEGQISKHTRVIRFRWLAAAALLSIVVTAMWLFSPWVKSTSQTLTTTKQKAQRFRWNALANTCAKAYVVKLADGSVVTLAPNAVIKYQEHFGEQEQRNIYIEGEAYFKVAHDKAKPFIVHTKSFSTIALGTSFMVSESAITSTIKLFEGKVLIKPTLSTLKGWKTDMILLPGNEMKYSFKAGTVVVSRFNTIAGQPSRSSTHGFSDKNESALVFDNTALSDVIKALHARYHSPILYNEELLSGKYFSGEVSKKDSLLVLLKVIANMNGLQVTKNNDTYVITESN